MLILIRFFFISLLIVLQFAAPLLHAHKNSVASFGTLIHLPEFEQVNTLLKHAPEFAAPTHHDEGIVAISAGMKNEQQHLLQTGNTIFVLLLSLFLLAKVTREPCYFPLQTEPIPDTHFFNLASPRAPPFFTFR